MVNFFISETLLNICLTLFDAPRVEPVIGRYDASYGLVLKGNSKEVFKVLDLEKTYFFADGDRKIIISIRNPATEKSVIVSRNTNFLKVLSFGNRLKN